MAHSLMVDEVPGKPRFRVDLRSDTVTLPTAAMKQAMMDAPLGDDVLGDDPTVRALETYAAEISGKQAALFVPSGTMANQIAIRLHTVPGDEVLMFEGAHPYNYEAAGAAAISGVQVRGLPADGGILDVDVVAAAIRPADDHFAPASLLCVEDTSNRGGGAVYPLERLDALCQQAHSRRLASHLDGARVFNAVVASGIPLARRCAGFDTVSFCLSKGLGAPIGSMLCGSAEPMARGRRVRKMLGGGMRQSGIIAAAGLYALENNIRRLADDHTRARQLAEGLRALGLDVAVPDTNMVYVQIDDASGVQDSLWADGIGCFATGPASLRMVVHLGVDDEGVNAVVEAFSKLVNGSV
jgi:threonine aldolase